MWRLLPATAMRALTSLLAAFAWLVLSNHCALSLIIFENQPVSTQAADGCCAHRPPLQPQSPHNDNLPCCKKSPALMAISIQSLSRQICSLGSVAISSLPEARSELAIESRLLLDTGPPRHDLFVQMVLQRSLPAHAPPSLI
jgi:hypothetical protein